MATSQIAGMSDTQWDALVKGAQTFKAQTSVPVGPTLPKTTPIPTVSIGANGVPNVVTKTGYTPSVAAPTPSVGTSTPNIAQINSNASATAAKSTTSNINQSGGVGQAPYGPTIPNKSIGEPPPSSTTPPVTTPIVNTTTPNTGLYVDPFARSREDIAKLAADRIAKILQAGKTSANGALTGAKNAYDYTNQIQGDNRSLRNASLKESANPFGGSFGYQAAMNNRNDSIADTAQDNDYNAQVGLINQKLADLQAAAPGDEQAIIDQLEQIERQTGISVAQLQEQQRQNQFNNGMANKQFALDESSVTGQYKNNQTMQSQNQGFNQNMQNKTYNQNQQVIDYNQDPNNPLNKGQVLQNQGTELGNKAQEQQNILNQYKINDYPAESKAAAELIQQQLKAGKLSNEAADYNLKQLKDPNSTVNQAAKLDLQMKQIDASSYSQENKLKLQQLQKQIAEIGKVHTTPQTSTEIEMDKVRLQTAQEQLKQLQNPKNDPNKPLTAEDYQKKLNPRYDNGVLANPQEVGDQILLSGLSEYEQYRAWISNGLPWDKNDPIPPKPTS